MLQPQPPTAALPAATTSLSPLAVQAASLSQVKDSRWLTLEVCREFQRNKCSRTELECKFAHPPPQVEVVNGRVTACYDSIKGRCTRKEPPCKYLHPPQHLREQLLQNGKQNLILRNLQLQALGASAATALPFSPLLPMSTALYAGSTGTLQSLGSSFVTPVPGGVPSPGLITNTDAQNGVNSPSSTTPADKVNNKLDRMEGTMPGVLPMMKRPTLDTRAYLPQPGLPATVPGYSSALLQPYSYLPTQMPLTTGPTPAWGAGLPQTASASPAQMPHFVPVSCDYLTGQPANMSRF